MPTIFIDVEESQNCPVALQLLFSTLGEAKEVRQVRLYHKVVTGALYDVTGWMVGRGQCPAMAVPVEDSGQACAYLVFGGDAGIRLHPVPADSRPAPPWSLNDPDQWGESHLLLSDVEDVIWQD